MIIKTTKQKDYELLDSGRGEKLERYGDFVLSRPDPEALWEKSLDKKIWNNTDFRFIRKGNKTEWYTKKEMPKNWNIEFGDLRLKIMPSSFKHVGLFPEQLLQWEWTENKILEFIKENKKTPKVLNLFAYTGGATLACAKVGAEVTHVDGSRTAIAWARENAELSNLQDKPIRWIIEDCVSYLKREIKRGNKYDAIIMDPPAFGHGPHDELWKIEEHFLELFELCKKVINDKPLFMIVNGYTAGYSSIAYMNVMQDLVGIYGGSLESGELVIEESGKKKRLLPCGIFARWYR